MSKNERLKKAIEEIKFIYKLKQSEIAEELEVTGTYLSDMINGRVPLSGKMVNKLSELFHISTDWLEEGRGDIMSNTSTVAMEPLPAYNSDRGFRIDIKGYERIIKALESTITAKDETIASQRYAIEALKGEVKALKKMTDLLTKDSV